ncbi:MAG: gfo/Idh/MocA family oxidoreductase, partial [Gammaproteobacteria bacterium]|nr:gfo/Idh/MocA family oxidoreductase [Gammaproteobacteria bacterium]
KGDDVSQHYGAEGKMAVDITRHLEHGAPLPVSVLDALEAGLTAMKIDESRRTGQVVDLTDLWARFDELTVAS